MRVININDFFAVSTSDKVVSNDTKRQDDVPPRLFDKSSGDASSTNTRHVGSTDGRTTGGATALAFGTASSNLFSQRTHESLPGKSQNGCVISKQLYSVDGCHLCLKYGMVVVCVIFLYLEISQ